MSLLLLFAGSVAPTIYLDDGGFIIPDVSAHPCLTRWTQTDSQIIFEAMRGNLVNLGCKAAPTVPGSLLLSLASGTISTQGASATLAETNVGFVLPLNYPRIDVLSLYASGGVAYPRVTSGEESFDPYPAEPPDNDVAICFVYLFPGMTAIGADEIVDKRFLQAA